jgi:arylesterase/paraoxonase
VKKFKISILLFLLFVLAFVGKTLLDSGYFKTIKPHFNGTVQVVEGITGAEDLTIDQETGLAFLSSDDRRSNRAGKFVQGAIYTLDLKQTSPLPQRIPGDLPRDFHPHGISLFKTTDGRKLLFVINHSKGKQLVEIFEFDGKKLLHLESIKHSLITSPNDILAVGKRSFYISNDHGYPRGFQRMAEEYLRLPLANVIYFDGQKASVAADGIVYANGINMSTDEQTLFVSSTIGQKILVYKRDAFSGRLTEEDEIPCQTGVDNIEKDGQGNLWVGCHPQMLAFVAHAKDVNKRSSSQVLKISYAGKKKYQLEEIYMNDGNPISGSSVGAVYGNQMLVGAVFDSKVLLAKLPQ